MLSLAPIRTTITKLSLSLQRLKLSVALEMLRRNPTRRKAVSENSETLMESGTVRRRLAVSVDGPDGVTLGVSNTVFELFLD